MFGWRLVLEPHAPKGLCPRVKPLGRYSMRLGASTREVGVLGSGAMASFAADIDGLILGVVAVGV